MRPRLPCIRYPKYSRKRSTLPLGPETGFEEVGRISNDKSAYAVISRLLPLDGQTVNNPMNRNCSKMAAGLLNPGRDRQGWVTRPVFWTKWSVSVTRRWTIVRSRRRGCGDVGNGFILGVESQDRRRLLSEARTAPPLMSGTMTNSRAVTPERST